MILTPRFSFIHLHKCGGTFVAEALLRHVPGATKLGNHAPASLLPASHAHLPVLGVVRNPWDFYVSWFTFQLTRRSYVWRAFSDDGALDFAETTRRMLRAGEDEPRLARLIEDAPVEFPHQQINLTKTCFETLRGQQHGWYTFLYRRMYGALPVHVMHMEHLRDELLAFLQSMDVATPALTEYVRTASPINTTEHAPYRDYYSSSLRDLVAERDCEIIERFGYTFD